MSEARLSVGRKGSRVSKASAPRLESEGLPVLEDERAPIGTGLPPPPEDELASPRAGLWRRHRLFIVTVVLPMAIAACALLLVASPRYGSTASFVVRSIDRNATEDALSSLTSSLASTNASDEVYAIVAFLKSRGIVEQLAAHDDLRAILGRSRRDFLFRYPTFWLPDNREFLYRRFQWMTTADVDPETGISTIGVSAFTPEDARALAQAMLRHAQALINRMNERFYQSQTASAERFVVEARKRLGAVEAELKDFRNRSGSLDPNLVAKSELDVIQGLSSRLAQVEAQIMQQVRLAPTSPALAGLRAQARSYRDEMERRSREIAGGVDSEAAKLATYDQLILRRDLAVQTLTDAMTQLELARSDAARQHLYVQIIMQPSFEPDWARYPQITFDLASLLAICLGVFMVLRKLRDIALEHRP